VQSTAADSNATNQASAAAQLDGAAPANPASTTVPSPAATISAALSSGQNQSAAPTAVTAQANAAATGATPAGSQDDQEHRKNLSNSAGDNPASLGAAAINPNAVAIAAATPNTDPAAVSDSAIVADKDKKSAVDAAAKPAATAATDPSLGAPAGPGQNTVSKGSETAAANASQQSGSVGQTDQARFLQRVTAAFQSVGDRNGSVRIMLSPPELGTLRLEVSVQNGTLTAHLQAETPAARNLLLDNLPALRDRLSNQNIKVDRFDVDLMDRQPGGGTSGQAFSQSQSNFQGSYSGGGTGGRTPSASRPLPVTAVPTSAREVVETTRLNVVV
jgi:flagellar hook-length control protein FliK